ncbi:hypothetical protein ANN_14463 [Periplaneta americana]|uniref:Endonuclease-reverse transcriptase n=1 Tax=Periplaneta americana TaxID=6978 RepID=A0ABQ8SX06_PERAM|nr:hypothetical protein ANN_14463 [Periplaneta americana]
MKLLTDMGHVELHRIHSDAWPITDRDMLTQRSALESHAVKVAVRGRRRVQTTAIKRALLNKKHISRDQNIVRNGNIKIGDLSFEEVEKFKYLGATVTNINDTREEIKRRINMGNACYYSVEKLLSSSLLSKNLKVRIYKTVILPVLLYGCETWTLTLREEHRFRVFENKVLRKIFGAKRDEVTGEWRKLHNTELHALYSSPDIIRNIKSRRLRWAGHVARMGESRNAYRVLVWRPEGKRPLGRPRRRWEDNIKMDLREVGYDDRDWINLAQDRDRWRAYVRAAMNLRHGEKNLENVTHEEAVATLKATQDRVVLLVAKPETAYMPPPPDVSSTPPPPPPLDKPMPYSDSLNASMALQASTPRAVSEEDISRPAFTSFPTPKHVTFLRGSNPMLVE